MHFAILPTLLRAREQQEDMLTVTTQDARELTEDEQAQFSGGHDCHHYCAPEHHCHPHHCCHHEWHHCCEHHF